jgi:hypothetical protein
MTEGDPTLDEVRAAIEKSGYLLEQDVAIRLQSLGFSVHTAAAYEDPDEHKSREIDVLAYRPLLHDEEQRFSIGLQIIAECKNTANPFVFITRDRDGRQEYLSPPEIMFPRGDYRDLEPIDPKRGLWRNVSGFHRFGLAPLHYYHGQPTKTVQFCRLLRKKSWDVDQGGVYDSLFYPLVKALRALLERSKPRGGPNDWRSLRVFVPLVVTVGPLFRIDASSTDRTPQRVTHATYSRDLHIQREQRSYTIDFVSLEGLADFVNGKLLPFGQAVVTVAAEAGSALFADPHNPVR